METPPPTSAEIIAAKEALLVNRDGSISDMENRNDLPPSEENVKHSKVLQYLINNPNYKPLNGGSRRRSRPSRKYKKSKRVFRKKSRSTRRR
jgi:hypothetical protein